MVDALSFVHASIIQTIFSKVYTPGSILDTLYYSNEDEDDDELFLWYGCLTKGS